VPTPNLRTRDFSRTTLHARHRPIVRALAEALLSHETPIAPAKLDAFIEDIDGFMSPASKTLRFGLLALLDLLSLIPILVIRKLSSFEHLSIADRVLMLQRLERSKFPPFLLIFVAYKTLMVMSFFEDEGELRSIGYPGPERDRYKRALDVVESK